MSHSCEGTVWDRYALLAWMLPMQYPDHQDSVSTSDVTHAGRRAECDVCPTGSVACPCAADRLHVSSPDALDFVLEGG